MWWNHSLVVVTASGCGFLFFSFFLFLFVCIWYIISIKAQLFFKIETRLRVSFSHTSKLGVEMSSVLALIRNIPHEIIESIVMRLGGGKLLLTCRWLLDSYRPMLAQFRWTTFFPTMSQTHLCSLYPFIVSRDQVLRSSMFDFTFQKDFRCEFRAVNMTTAYFWSKKFERCYMFNPHFGFDLVECLNMPPWFDSLTYEHNCSDIFANSRYVVVISVINPAFNQQVIRVAMLDLRTMHWTALRHFDRNRMIYKLRVVEASAREIKLMCLLNHRDIHYTITCTDPATMERIDLDDGPNTSLDQVLDNTLGNKGRFSSGVLEDNNYVRAFTSHGVFILKNGVLYLVHNEQLISLTGDDDYLRAWMSHNYTKMFVLSGDLVFLYSKTGVTWDVFYINAFAMDKVKAGTSRVGFQCGVFIKVAESNFAYDAADFAVGDALFIMGGRSSYGDQFKMRFFYPTFTSWRVDGVELSCSPAGIELLYEGRRYRNSAKFLYGVHDDTVVVQKQAGNKVDLMFKPCTYKSVVLTDVCGAGGKKGGKK